MHDSGLDFIIFTLVLGITVTIGFNTTNMVVRESREMFHVQMYDKTVDRLDGDRAQVDGDGGMSSSEVILTVMGQTHFMPAPGIIEIAGTRIEVSNNLAFSPNSLGLGMQAQNELSEWFNSFRVSSAYGLMTNPPLALADARFKVQFSMNDVSNTADDTYALFIILNRQGRQELFKCEPNGRIMDGGGRLL